MGVLPVTTIFAKDNQVACNRKFWNNKSRNNKISSNFFKAKTIVPQQMGVLPVTTISPKDNQVACNRKILKSRNIKF